MFSLVFTAKLGSLGPEQSHRMITEFIVEQREVVWVAPILFQFYATVLRTGRNRMIHRTSLRSVNNRLNKLFCLWYRANYTGFLPE